MKRCARRLGLALGLSAGLIAAPGGAEDAARPTESADSAEETPAASAPVPATDPPSPPPPPAEPEPASTFSYGTPPPPKSGESSARRRSTPLMVSGLVLAGLGGVSAIYGIAVLAGDQNKCLPLATAEECDRQTQDAVGIVLTIAGGALVATGIPLAVVGGSRVAVPAPDATKAELLIGPTGGALRVRF